MSDEPMERLVRSLKDDLDAAETERDRLRAVAFMLYRTLSDEPIETIAWLSPDQKELLAQVVEVLSPRLEAERAETAMQRLRAENNRLRAVVETARVYVKAEVDDRCSDVEYGRLRDNLRDALGQLDVSANIGGHQAQQVGRRFRSNACIHEEHEQCENVCPFCDDSCACACHTGGT